MANNVLHNRGLLLKLKHVRHARKELCNFLKKVIIIIITLRTTFYTITFVKQNSFTGSWWVQFYIILFCNIFMPQFLQFNKKILLILYLILYFILLLINLILFCNTFMSFKTFEFLCVSDDNFMNWIGEILVKWLSEQLWRWSLRLL